jgi:hypothetical protein
VTSAGSRERSRLLGDLCALPGASWVLILGTFVNWFGRFVVFFLALYLTKRGFSPAEAGSAIAAYGIGSIDRNPHERGLE